MMRCDRNRLTRAFIGDYELLGFLQCSFHWSPVSPPTASIAWLTRQHSVTVRCVLTCLPTLEQTRISIVMKLLTWVIKRSRCSMTIPTMLSIHMRPVIIPLMQCKTGGRTSYASLARAKAGAMISTLTARGKKKNTTEFETKRQFG